MSQMLSVAKRRLGALVGGACVNLYPASKPPLSRDHQMRTGIDAVYRIPVVLPI